MQIALEFSEETAVRLAEIKRKAAADTYAEVISNALRIYEWHIQQAEEGYEIGLVKDGVRVKPVTSFTHPAACGEKLKEAELDAAALAAFDRIMDRLDAEIPKLHARLDALLAAFVDRL